MAGDETAVFVAYQRLRVDGLTPNADSRIVADVSLVVRLDGAQPVPVEGRPDRRSFPTLIVRNGELFQLGKGRLATGLRARRKRAWEDSPTTRGITRAIAW